MKCKDLKGDMYDAYNNHWYTVLQNFMLSQCYNHCNFFVSVVEKDKDELHMKTFTYHPTEEGEEDSLQALEAPGKTD